jgi:hypothetical protein
MGGYKQHLDEFGTCYDDSHSGIEMMRFEFKDTYTGRHYFEEMPACAECFGLK